MKYEMRHPKTVREAADIIAEALAVISQQVEFNHGKRRRAWNGDFVVHLQKEAQNAIEFLRSGIQ